MGCDIHFHVEYLYTYTGTVNGLAAHEHSYWKPLDWPEVQCWLCKGTGLQAKSLDEKCHHCSQKPSSYDNYSLRRYTGKPGIIHEPWYDGRNYDVFAVLADVRNYDGRLKPIDQPRGLPDDVSHEIKQESDNYGIDGHSHQWLDLDEVLNYDWEQVVRHKGVVGEAGFKEWISFGYPKSWSGGVGGHGVEHVSVTDMALIVSCQKARQEGKAYFTKVEWDTPYSWSCKDFVDRMKEVKKAVGDAPCRLVFWFDN